MQRVMSSRENWMLSNFHEANMFAWNINYSDEILHMY